MKEWNWIIVVLIWTFFTLAAISFLVGCTQTATTLEPIKVGCYASCTPGGECTAELTGVGETGTDKSVLLDGVELDKTGEQE